MSVLCGTVLVQTLCLFLPDVRAAYGAVPAVGFMLFYFSGLMVKSSTYPDWLGPWLPSVSIIRWAMQAEFINQFDSNLVFPIVNNKYSTYDAFLSLFGWGGKTKLFCLEILIVNFIVYKVIMLLAIIKKTISQRGHRFARQHKSVERMY